MATWLSQWSTKSKVGLGVIAVLAASVGAGIVGVLPAGAQTGFDEVVSGILPGEVETENETDDLDESDTDVAQEHPDNFGGTVSDRAHELGKDSDGQAFGEQTSQDARDKGDALEGEDDATVEGDSDSGDDEGANGSNHSENGNGAGNSNRGKND